MSGISDMSGDALRALLVSIAGSAETPYQNAGIAPSMLEAAAKRLRDVAKTISAIESAPVSSAVTVYSTTGCRSCAVVKSSLRAASVDFQVINLLDQGEAARKEMFALTQSHTVPQVLFHGVPVGGLESVQSMQANGTLQSEIERCRQQNSRSSGNKASSPRFKSDHVAAAPSADRLPTRASGNQYNVDLEDTVARVRGSLKIHRRVWGGGLTWHTDCFQGTKLVDAILATTATNEIRRLAVVGSSSLSSSLAPRDLARALGRRLVDELIVHPVQSSTSEPGKTGASFKDDAKLYRFQEDVGHRSGDLNMARIHRRVVGSTVVHAARTPSTATPSAIAEAMRSSILRLYDEFISADGSSVDYEGMAKSAAFRQYRLSTCVALQTVDLEGLTSNRDASLAFWINVYNALVIHGLVETSSVATKPGVSASEEASSESAAPHNSSLGPDAATSGKKRPTGVLSRLRFFSSTSYRIGGLSFSLDDIEHGILRGNKRSPAKLLPQFKSGDARLRFAIQEMDPRVHFALVCGAKGCPSINLYSTSGIHDELDAAAKSFFSDDGGNFALAERRSGNGFTVTLSKILMWYSKDFGATDEEVLGFIRTFLSGESQKQLEEILQNGKPKIEYIDYDWSLNGH
jgi:glutaredoxin